MQALQAYLFFNGNCSEAMEFYAQVLNGKLSVMTYAQGPNAPSTGSDRIMHSNILAPDGSALMASEGRWSMRARTSRFPSPATAATSRIGCSPR